VYDSIRATSRTIFGQFSQFIILNLRIDRCPSVEEAELFVINQTKLPNIDHVLIE
jgi:hypothetical protein